MFTNPRWTELVLFLDLCAPASDGEQKADDSWQGGLHRCYSWISVLCNKKVRDYITFIDGIITIDNLIIFHYLDASHSLNVLLNFRVFAQIFVRPL